jgi:hypothetical protein
MQLNGSARYAARRRARHHVKPESSFWALCACCYGADYLAAPGRSGPLSKEQTFSSPCVGEEIRPSSFLPARAKIY